jgi:hypothetical protein
VTRHFQSRRRGAEDKPSAEERLRVAPAMGSGAVRASGPSVPPARRMSTKNVKKTLGLIVLPAIHLKEANGSSPAAAQSCLHTSGVSDAPVPRTGMAVGFPSDVTKTDTVGEPISTLLSQPFCEASPWTCAFKEAIGEA